MKLFGALTLSRRDRERRAFSDAPGRRRALRLPRAELRQRALPRRRDPSDLARRARWNQAARGLRQELAALRRQLEEPGETLFLADRNSLSLAEGAIQTDISRFLELLSGGRSEIDVSRLTEAVGLYRGELLRDLPRRVGSLRARAAIRASIRRARSADRTGARPGACAGVGAQGRGSRPTR